MKLPILLSISVAALFMSACTTHPQGTYNSVQPNPYGHSNTYDAPYTNVSNSVKNIPEAGPLTPVNQAVASVAPQPTYVQPAAPAPAPAPAIASPLPAPAQPAVAAVAPAVATPVAPVQHANTQPTYNPVNTGGGYDNYAAHNTAPVNPPAPAAPANNPPPATNYAANPPANNTNTNTSYTQYNTTPDQNESRYDSSSNNSTPAYASANYDYGAPSGNAGDTGTSGTNYYSGGDSYASGNTGSTNNSSGIDYSAGTGGGSMASNTASGTAAIQLFATGSRTKADTIRMDMQSLGVTAVVDQVDGLFKVRIPFSSDSEARSNLARIRSLSGESGAFVTSRS